eukprot:420437_1
MAIGGNWTFLLSNNTAKLEVISALEKDLKLHFGAAVTVTELVIATSSRRRAAGDMTVKFTVFATRDTLSTQLSTLQALPLTSTKVAFTAITGEDASSISVGVITDPSASAP